MKTKPLVCLFMLMIFAGFASANNREKNVMGTVKTVTSNAITVETMGNSAQSVVIAMLPATRFIKDGRPASAKDLKTGDHLVASAKPNGDKLEATQIVFGRIFDHMDMHHH
jgi:hypothetical protein